MPLLSPDPPTERKRPPWRGVVVGALAAALFIVGLAVAAYATRDRAGPVRPMLVDAGAVEALPALTPIDAGGAQSLDAGQLVTAEPEPDAGPMGPAGPPVELSALVLAAEPVLADCLREALRFDPSFGGRVRLTAELRGRTLRILPPPGASPVFAGCLTQHAGRVEGAPTNANAELNALLDGLRGTATIDDAHLLE